MLVVFLAWEIGSQGNKNNSQTLVKIQSLSSLFDLTEIEFNLLSTINPPPFTFSYFTEVWPPLDSLIQLGVTSPQ